MRSSRACRSPISRRSSALREGSGGGHSSNFMGVGMKGFPEGGFRLGIGINSIGRRGSGIDGEAIILGFVGGLAASPRVYWKLNACLT